MARKRRSVKPAHVLNIKKVRGKKSFNLLKSGKKGGVKQPLNNTDLSKITKSIPRKTGHLRITFMSSKNKKPYMRTFVFRYDDLQDDDILNMFHDIVDTLESDSANYGGSTIMKNFSGFHIAYEK